MDSEALEQRNEELRIAKELFLVRTERLNGARVYTVKEARTSIFKTIKNTSKEPIMTNTSLFADTSKERGFVTDFGEHYLEFSGKPVDAIEYLLEKKSGYVPAAIYKDNVGDIDFVWGKGGKDGFGFAHIIERRESEGLDGEEFVRKIPELISEGTVNLSKYSDRVFITNKSNTAVIRLDYNGEKATWLVTAFTKK
jgi:hypothetical protein